MMKEVAIEGEMYLFKDLDSGAILSKDSAGREARLLERERIRQMRQDHELLMDLKLRIERIERLFP